MNQRWFSGFRLNYLTLNTIYYNPLYISTHNTQANIVVIKASLHCV